MPKRRESLADRRNRSLATDSVSAAAAAPPQANGLDDLSALIRSRNQTELALAAGIQQSAISMALRYAESQGKKGRPLSRRAALNLAKALCPVGEEVRNFADRLFERFNPPGRRLRNVDLSKIGSVADRIRSGQKVKVGYVESPPFVTKDGPNYRGFAFDIWRHLANLMKVEEAPQHPTVDFRNMGDVLAERGCDIIVTALLPTFRRRTFMDFSRPLPYLGIPLSGIVKNSFKEDLVKRADGRFCAQHLLGADRDELKLAEFQKKKLLLVKGEAGEEFVSAFFDAPIEELLRRNQEWAEDLTPSALAKTMIEKDIDIFIADVGSCKALLDEPAVRREYRPLADAGESRLSQLLPAVKLGRHEFAQLGVYRICFGLPRLDEDWAHLIDQAMDFLMTEGIRSLLSVYLEYVERDIGRDSFIPFLLDDDDTVASSVVRRLFKPLIDYARNTAHLKDEAAEEKALVTEEVR